MGVRPSIARLAGELGLAGFVTNRNDGVAVVVEGQPERVDEMRRRLVECLPAKAVVEAVRADEIPAVGRQEFAIERERPAAGPLGTGVPTDMAVCGECLKEVASAEGKRSGYSFTSCTDCGPRYSIIEAMPYERAQTTMARFPLCPSCRREDTDAADRRFHAQTNACPACGPRLWCRDRNGRIQGRDGDAVGQAVAAIQAGEVVAVRGLGGYQLMVDATNAGAVRRLRERKRRPAKPLAVMVDSLAGAEGLAELDDAERRLLSDPANPIVLLRARTGNGLASAVHPGLVDVGVMLPTTPLHWQIVTRCGRPLVVTSGNREGEPQAYEADDSERTLECIADLWLHHDRPIRRPVDDSVARVIAGRRVTLRCARGWAPLTLPELPPEFGPWRRGLAVGGHQKCAVALCNGAQPVLGAHIGDMDTAAARTRFIEQVGDLVALYGAEPGFVAHDLHPEYFTTRWAVDHTAEHRGRAVAVQHHHAHVVAGMWEHGWLDRDVIGIAFDGTGYGRDGTIWGGEILLATARSFRRVARLRPFRLPGGEAAVRQPWRVAASLIHQSLDREAAMRAVCELFPAVATGDSAKSDLARLIEHDRFSPRTTSAGRLFDAAAAITMGCTAADFEGQPAMWLEALCDRGEEVAYSIPRTGSEPFELDWRPLVRSLLRDRAVGVSPTALAMRFHRGLAAAVVAACGRWPGLPVVLSGGCFQNRVLTDLIAEGLSARGRVVGTPGMISPNDGGLAAGQLAVGLARLTREGGE
jgi:hydrogenase maturation protein HypF